MRSIVVVATGLLALSGLAAPALAEQADAGPCGPEAVTVVVDAEMLDDDVEIRCLGAPESGQTVLETLTAAGFHVDGTTEYPTSIVCRVDDAPHESREPCDAMPAADAYWSVWDGTADGWAFAQEAVDAQTVASGDVIGLAFQEGADERQPAVSPADAVEQAEPADEEAQAEEDATGVPWTGALLGGLVVVVLAGVLFVLVRRRG